MKKLVYTGRDGESRLDGFILQQIPWLASGMMHKYLRQNKIKLNGKKQPLSTRLRGGDEVFLFLPEAALREPPLHILYEDENLLAINKPAGLPSMSRDESLDTGSAYTALAAIRRYLAGETAGFRPILCHRLDTGTSGVLLAAKTAEGESFVLNLIRAHRLKKEYLCVTVGHPAPAAGELSGWLTKDARAGRVKIHAAKQPGAKPVKLGYKTMGVSGTLALVQVELFTGRTHQIRAQFAAASTPLLGDSKYGTQQANRRWHCKYQCLCAAALRFPAHIEDEAFEKYAGLVLQCPPPWFVGAMENGELGGGA